MRDQESKNYRKNRVECQQFLYFQFCGQRSNIFQLQKYKRANQIRDISFRAFFYPPHNGRIEKVVNEWIELIKHHPMRAPKIIIKAKILCRLCRKNLKNLEKLKMIVDERRTTVRYSKHIIRYRYHSSNTILVPVTF